MNKNFKVKAIFLCLLVLIVSALALLPKEPLKAETQNNKVYLNYALLSLGYKDAKDKNSLQIEEYIGVELDFKTLTEAQKQQLKSETYGYFMNYKNELNLPIFNSSIIVSDAKIEGNFIFVKITYLNLPAYYLFNGRQVTDNNSSQAKPYDIYENGVLYNKYHIVLGNPLRVFRPPTLPSTNVSAISNSGQTCVDVFKNNYYKSILNNIKNYTESYSLKFLFDYSSSDDRLYGNYSLKYNITGINSNKLTVYEFTFNEDDIPNSVNLYFVTFNQYIWYVVAIAVALIVIGGLYLVVFIKGRKEKKNFEESENNLQNGENLLNTSEE